MVGVNTAVSCRNEAKRQDRTKLRCSIMRRVNKGHGVSMRPEHEGRAMTVRGERVKEGPAARFEGENGRDTNGRA